MQRILYGDVPLWQFDLLQREARLKHFVTDRQTVSGRSFTLSYSSSPDRQEIIHNRTLLAEALGISFGDLYLPSQVHQTRIVAVTRDTTTDDLKDTDALVTRERDIAIAVMSADCVPVLLYDRTHQVVAAIHAGWRGTVARILDKTLHYLHQHHDTRGTDLVAAIGPSVCQASYEVGEEVVRAVEEAFGADAAALMIPQPQHKAKLDLWQANRLQLLQFGVPAEQIEVGNQCTVIHNEHFFSARRGDAGRFAAGIMMTS